MTRALLAISGLLVLAGGAIHLDRYLAEYNEGTIGTLFLVNVIASAVIALWLFVHPDRLGILAALALELGTLAAFFWSRNHTLFGFQSDEMEVWEIASVIVEATTALLLVIAFAMASRRERPDRRRPSGPRPVQAFG